MFIIQNHSQIEGFIYVQYNVFLIEYLSRIILNFDKEWKQDKVIKTPHSEIPTQKRTDLLPVSKIIRVASAICESLPYISVTRGCKTNHTLFKMF